MIWIGKARPGTRSVFSVGTGGTCRGVGGGRAGVLEPLRVEWVVRGKGGRKERENSVSLRRDGGRGEKRRARLTS